MPGNLVPFARSDLEAQISRAVIHFEKEFMGRGPLETKTYLLDDMILVRLKGVLTPAERKLSESQRDRGNYLLKQVRNELLLSGRPMLEAVIQDIVGVPVQSVHTDISTKTGERVIVMTLQQRPMLSGSNGQRADCREVTDSSVDPEAPAMVLPLDDEHPRDGRRKSVMR